MATKLECMELVIKKNHGYIEQVPNIFSAIKINGKRAYSLARSGVKKHCDAKNNYKKSSIRF